MASKRLRERRGGRDIPTNAFVLRLYVSGATAKSAEAIGNLKDICETHISGKYRLEVVDIYQQPERAAKDHVVAVPMLVRYFPLPVQRIIGTLSDAEQVVRALHVAGAAGTLGDSGVRTAET